MSMKVSLVTNPPPLTMWGITICPDRPAARGGVLKNGPTSSPSAMAATGDEAETTTVPMKFEAGKTALNAAMLDRSMAVCPNGGKLTVETASGDPFWSQSCSVTWLMFDDGLAIARPTVCPDAENSTGS